MDGQTDRQMDISGCTKLEGSILFLRPKMKKDDFDPFFAVKWVRVT